MQISSQTLGPRLRSLSCIIFLSKIPPLSPTPRPWHRSRIIIEAQAANLGDAVVPAVDAEAMPVIAIRTREQLDDAV
jgi:hypothetical protein